VSKELRDENADYQAAMMDEYDSYVRGGRIEDAEHVAAVLNDRYGQGVDVKAKRRAAKRASAPERADQKAPEEAVPSKPSHTEAQATTAEGD